MLTPLDRACAARALAPDDDGLRLRFHERVLDAELVVPLEPDAAGDRRAPRVFDLSDGRYALAFDRDERLADFLGAPAPFAALSGRRLAALLSESGVGLALNLGAPSATLLPAAAVDWLSAMAAGTPAVQSTRLGSVSPPGTVPPALEAALGPKLAAMAPVIDAAWLVRAGPGEGDPGLLLVLVGVPEAARDGVAAAVAEAVRFAPGIPGLDLVFLPSDAPALARVRRAGARLATPVPPPARFVPGMDPARPPDLRGRRGPA